MTSLSRVPFGLDWRRLAPALAAVAVAIAYLIIRPRTGDLAAHVYRVELFERDGFAIWNGAWYAGHHAIAYSVLFPPLAWLLGPLPLGALSAVVSAVLFERIARAQWGENAVWGALWFGLATGTLLITGRLPFALGVALALAALLALERRHGAVGYALAVVCSLTSPVAALFLAMAGLVDFLAGERRRGTLLAVASFAPAALVTFVFPEGGHQPIGFAEFWPLPVLMAACLVFLPRAERRLRIGAVVYALAGLAAYLLPTPMGSNALRLGELLGGVLLLCAVAGRWPAGRVRRVALGALLVALAAWQLSPPVRAAEELGDPSSRTSYYQPLLTQLDRRVKQPTRIEIPFTRGHWEAAEVAPRYALARGWERQLDLTRNGLFYGGALNARTYGAWLSEHGVGWVAVASAKPDWAGAGERALVEAGLPYLKLRWRSSDWRLYEVTLAHPLVVPERGAAIRPLRLGDSSVTLEVTRPGSALVRVQWSPYWRASGGACVERHGQWTRVLAKRPGRLRVAIDFSAARIVDHGRRCG
ncbi:MAG: hypothetical protein QOC77_3108 [Thermoleophilaceae bacterium]|nr:hypothetical protein [Thermoleophilaceae bacterium]